MDRREVVLAEKRVQWLGNTADANQRAEAAELCRGAEPRYESERLAEHHGNSYGFWRAVQLGRAARAVRLEEESAPAAVCAELHVLSPRGFARVGAGAARLCPARRLRFGAEAERERDWPAKHLHQRRGEVDRNLGRWFARYAVHVARRRPWLAAL